MPSLHDIDLSHGSDGSFSIQRRDALALLLITLLGAGLRLVRLDAQSAWFDEAFSIAHSVRPMAELFEVLRSDVAHPPLHYLILRGWFGIAGYGALEARQVSVFFGTLSIPLLYLLARRVADSRTGLCAAFLLSISQIAIYFSQEARAYAQTQFLSLVAALAFLSFLRNPSLVRSIWFGAAGTALLYTHYYGAGCLLGLGVYWLIFRRDYSPLVFRRLGATVVLMAVAFVPWLLVVKSGDRLRQGQVFSANRISSQRPNLFSPAGALNRFNNTKFDSIEGATSLAASLTGLAVFTLPAVGALWFAGRNGSRGALLGWLMAAIPAAMAILLGGAFGAIYNYRHFGFAVPGYYLAVAIGWRFCLRGVSLRLAWLAIATGISAYALRANFLAPTKPDYRASFLPMARSYRPSDCVTARPTVWRNRVHLAWEVYYGSRGTWRPVPWDSLPAGAAECERLWLVWDRTWWMNQNAEADRESRSAIATLSERYTVRERHEHPAVELQLLEIRGTQGGSIRH